MSLPFLSILAKLGNTKRSRRLQLNKQESLSRASTSSLSDSHSLPAKMYRFRFGKEA